MKPFLKFILSILALLACCAVADFFIGKALDQILDRVPQSGNDAGETHFAVKKVMEPVLIVGSSRAKYHYDSIIFTDSLCLDTYNIGRPGYYISYHCCLINMILDRYTPDMIIWDISLESLFARAQDPIRILNPYYWDYRAVQEAIDEKEGKTARIKNISNIYRYNGLIVDLFDSWLDGTKVDSLKGMEPIIYTGKKVDPEMSIKKSVGGPIDSARVKRLHDTLHRLSEAGVKVFVFDSPEYSIREPDRDKSSQSIIYEECQCFSIPVFDNRSLEYFLHHPELFLDDGHLFDDGARLYSQIAAHQINQYLQEESGKSEISDE